MENLIKLVLEWGISKNITGENGKATARSQGLKVKEECEELRVAVRQFTKETNKRVPNQDKVEKWVNEIVDAVGDSFVTIILEAEIIGTDLVSCVNVVGGHDYATFEDVVHAFMEDDVQGGIKHHAHAVAKLGRNLTRMAQDGRNDLLPTTIGMIAISLLAFCKKADLRPVDCLQAAYEVISKRRGLTIDGTFIKFENLTEEQKKLVA